MITHTGSRTKSTKICCLTRCTKVPITTCTLFENVSFASCHDQIEGRTKVEVLGGLSDETQNVWKQVCPSFIKNGNAYI